jgi:uncharacterized MAPEG superfamily protein
MTGWILGVLALFVAQTLIVPTTRYYMDPATRRRGFKMALGPRDKAPPLPLEGERAQRALKNMFEALPVFLTLALLIQIEGNATALAHAGAAIFLAARVAYVPLYMMGTFGLRTASWLAGWAGLLLMLAALLV